MFSRQLACRILTSLALVAALTGCMGPSAEETETVHLMFEDLRNDRIDAALARLPASLDTPETRDSLVVVADLIPPDAPQSERTIGWTRTDTDGGSAITIDDELTYPDRILMRRAVVQLTNSGQTTLIGFHVRIPSAAAIEQAKFTLTGKSAVHYLFLAVAIVVPLIIIAALVLLLRGKGRRRKWLWAIFIALGLGKFSINWATGAVSLQALSFSILGSGFFKSDAAGAPWLISVGVPVGAIIFLASYFYSRRAAPPVPGA